MAPTVRVRAGIGLFGMDDRGLLELTGSDRVRWLDGMVTRNVKQLAERGEGAGCHALFLTHRGAIVAELRIGRLGEAFLLECARGEAGRIKGELEKRIIADDVALSDRSGAQAVLGIEGARARDVLASAAGIRAGVFDREAQNRVDGIPDQDDWARLTIAGQPILVAAFGWSGERAFQLRMEPDARTVVREALVSAAISLGIEPVAGDPALLEILRVEAGIPALGAELDEDVLPAEARLEAAIATNKGCYVGQEIVARLRSRGQVNHLLVGLRLAGETALPAVGAALSSGGRVIGEVTSAVRSPTEGCIALGYVRREQAEPGTVLEVAEAGSGRVVALPFVRLSDAAPVNDRS